MCYGAPQVGLLRRLVDNVEELAIGYMIHRPFWRRGLAMEAATACLDYAFDRLEQRRVISLIRPKNYPSLGVARKLGMKVEKPTTFAGLEHLVFVSFKSRRVGLDDNG